MDEKKEYKEDLCRCKSSWSTFSNGWDLSYCLSCFKWINNKCKEPRCSCQTRPDYPPHDKQTEKEMLDPDLVELNTLPNLY